MIMNNNDICFSRGNEYCEQLNEKRMTELN